MTTYDPATAPKEDWERAIIVLLWAQRFNAALGEDWHHGHDEIEHHEYGTRVLAGFAGIGQPCRCGCLEELPT